MADLVAGDVTYTQQPNLSRRIEGPRSTGQQVLTKVAFGDGAKTVPATGIPLVVKSLGIPQFVKRLRVIGDATNAGRDYLWNGSETAPALLADAVTAPATGTILTLEVEGY